MYKKAEQTKNIMICKYKTTKIKKLFKLFVSDFVVIIIVNENNSLSLRPKKVTANEKVDEQNEK